MAVRSKGAEKSAANGKKGKAGKVSLLPLLLFHLAFTIPARHS